MPDSRRGGRLTRFLGALALLALLVTACARGQPPAASPPLTATVAEPATVVPVGPAPPTSEAPATTAVASGAAGATPTPAPANGLGATPTGPPAAVIPPTAPASPVSADRSATDRDPVDIARRFRWRPGTPTPGPLPAAERPPLGQERNFWINDETAKRYFEVRARLAYQSEHVDAYVQEQFAVPTARLQASIDRFENTTYPMLRDQLAGGRDVLRGRRVTILNARLPGVLGSFSSSDAYPRSVVPFSNERLMLYMNVEQLRPGSAAYDSTLVHEATHLTQWLLDPSDDSWVDEGTAEYATRLAGFVGPGGERAFFARPTTQLNTWAEEIGARSAHYGAAELFFTYLADHYGGAGAIGSILAHPDDGIPPIDAFLRTKGTSFDRVFADWVTANLMNDRSLSNGRYGYISEVAGRATPEAASLPIVGELRVPQYSARYLRVEPGGRPLRIEVTGDATTSIIGNSPRSGQREWWSGRGDSLNTRLTRSLDLSGVTAATLRFWLWYDIEEDYDYGYVAVSADGGQSWTTLPTRHTRSNDPNGANLGHGWTGHSGGGDEPVWILDEVDLTQFAGRTILLRFEYVTDDAVHGPGLALDDLEIGQLGWQDDAEAIADWSADGFVLTTNSVPQSYAVRVVTLGRSPTVSDVRLDENRSGRLTVAASRDPIVIVVAAMAPDSLVPARLRLDVRADGR